ncbi:uncharacterized protein [Haliotis asinina]|uniref:uncharacterized protein n=1 Tax=Haliotis asinina TaxID=109174 RepID=UPI003532600C
MEGWVEAENQVEVEVLAAVVLLMFVVVEENTTGYLATCLYESQTIDFSHLVGKVQPVPSEIVSFDELLREYTQKMADLQMAGLWKKTEVKTCEEEELASRPCLESLCPQRRPTTPEDNLRSVLSTVSELDHQHLSLIPGLFSDPPSNKRVMFVTAASSNHFCESQGLMRNLHQNVFPYIRNYTFVYYDLGLWPWQRNQVMRDCRCELRRFPVELMPPRLQNLRCYAWKSFIIQANLPKADILVWVDSSVRFWNKTMPQLLDDVEIRGIVTYADVHSVAQHSLKETMNYMKEDVCSLAPVAEDHGGFLLLHNERWIREAVIKPLVACAMSPKCMCPRYPPNVIVCDTDIRKYNKCHRFDQSAINIILAKLFRDHKGSFHSPYNEFPNVTLAR